MSPALEQHKPRELVYLSPSPLGGLTMRLSRSKLRLEVADREDAIRALDLLFDRSEYVMCMN